MVEIIDGAVLLFPEFIIVPCVVAYFSKEVHAFGMDDDVKILYEVYAVVYNVAV